MKIAYDQDTDSLYIHLSDLKAVDSDEVAEGIVLDFNDAGHVVGIDIQHASSIADVRRMIFEQTGMAKAA